MALGVFAIEGISLRFYAKYAGYFIVGFSSRLMLGSP